VVNQLTSEILLKKKRKVLFSINNHIYLQPLLKTRIILQVGSLEGLVFLLYLLPFLFFELIEDRNQIKHIL